MSRISLKTQILDYLKQEYPRFVEGGVIEDFARGWGKLASTGRDRLRELCKDGLVETAYYKGYDGQKLAKYRFKIPSDELARENFAKETGRITYEKMWNGNEYIMKQVLVNK